MENTQSEKIPEGRGTFIPKKGIDLQISALSRPHFFHREKKKKIEKRCPSRDKRCISCRIWRQLILLVIIVCNCIEIALVNEYNYEHFLARSHTYLTSYNFVGLSVTIFDNLF